MTSSKITPDELIATLKRSSLSHVLVEGKDDMKVYRMIEKKLGKFNADVLPCGGRDTLLKVYLRRHEFSHIKTVFLADKDLWFFSGIPDDYEEVIFTCGYSIENDLYLGAEVLLDSLLFENERNHFENLIESILPWFYQQVTYYLSGKEFKIKDHIDLLIPKYKNPDCKLETYYSSTINPLIKADEILSLLGDYRYSLRGKLLIESLVRVLEDRKYRSDQLFEIMTLLTNQNTFIDRIVDEIQKKLI